MKFLNHNRFFKRYLPLILSVILVITGLASYFLIQKSKPAEASWFSSSQGTWNYRQKITIDKDKVNTATGTTTPLSNFPVLISTTNVLFKSVNNGGHVGLDTGYDIVFTSGDGKTKLPHEIESYASTTGALIAWVKIPSLVSASDTTLYMYYGNATETGNEQNASGVWDSNYLGVYHLGNGTTLNTNDSTGVYNGTNSAATATTTGQIDGAGGFNGSSSNIYNDAFAYADPTPSATFSAWAKMTTSDGDFHTIADLGQGWLSLRVAGGSSGWGSIAWAVANQGGWNDCSVTYNNTYNQMHLYTGTYNSSNNAWLIYVDGTQIKDCTWTGTPGFMDKPILALGVMGKVSLQYYFGGIIDEFKASKTARTADWIKTEYNNQSSPSTFTNFGAEETQPAAQISGAWYNASWSYRKKITIPHANVSGTSTLSNFPVLISTTQQILSYTASGGHVASSTGGDILFTASDGRTTLNYEIEKYISTTGELVAWVQIPSLTPSTDNTIYMYYGNAVAPAVPATTAQNVWSNGYVGVWHLNNSPLNTVDSTVNPLSGTLAGSAVASSGQVDGGAAFTGGTTIDAINYTSHSKLDNLARSTMTFCAWEYVNAFDTTPRRLVNKGSDGTGNGWYIDTINSSSNRNTFSLRYNNGTGQTYFYNSGLPATTWFNYCVTYNGSNTANNAQVYINGHAVTTTREDAGIVSSGIADDSGYNWIIGNRQTTINRAYNGNMDELEFSNTIRTASWIATEYQNQSSPSTFSSIAGEETQQTTTFNSTWYSSAWSYRKPIAIDRRKVNTATGTTTPLTNFPVLVSITDTDLKNYASTTGADILFTSSDGKTKLNHEIESYNSATGQLIAWVSVPSLSNTSDTVLYLYFGNATATSQQSVASTWDSNYKAVYHLSTNSILTDSIGSYNLTNTGATAGNGQIDGAASLDGSSHFLSSASGPSYTTQITMSVWMRRNNDGTYTAISQGVNSSATSLGFNDAAHGDYIAFNDYNNGINSNNTYTDTGWHYVVLTIDTGIVTGKLYVDGVLQSAPYYNHINGSGNPVYIGEWAANSGQFMNGTVDEARVSNSIRTADWIKTEYLNQSAPATFYARGALQTQNHTAQQSNEQIVNRGWYNNKALGNWNYRMPLTISHNMVGSSTTATLSNFPVLVSVTNANLKSVSNGGGVASTSAADIVFTDNDGGTKLPHEIESYDAVNGILIAWVKVPILSTTIDHTIYIYYGNNMSNLPNQSNPTYVWDSNYKGVWHLPNGSSLSANDSTSNANNGTLSATPPTANSTGKIDGAVSFNGSSNYITTGNNSSLNFGAGSFTIDFWMNGNATQSGGNYPAVIHKSTGDMTAGSGVGWYFWWYNGGSNYQFTLDDGASSADNLYFGGNVLNGAWYHVVVVVTPAQLLGYVNGVALAPTTRTHTGSTDVATNLNMGYWGSYSRYWNGLLDEVKISNTARTPDWITTEYLNQSAPGSFITLGAQQTSGTAVQTTNWYNASWTNRRTITIDKSKISQINKTDLVNFPMLFSTTDNEFKLSPTGKVGQANGYDFVFTDSDGKTILNSEIETYNNSTGNLIAWVKIPNLSLSADKTIYLYYGNASASAPSSAFTQAVWDSSYKGVWHMKETLTAAGQTVSDSTGNANNASSVGTWAGSQQIAGKIDGSLNFNTAGENLNAGNNSSINSLFAAGGTMSAWVKSNSSGVGNFGGKIFDKSVYSLSNNNSGYYIWTYCFGSSCVTPGGWITPPGSFKTGSLVYLTVTYNNSSTSNAPSIYINGSSVALTNTNIPSGAVGGDTGYQMDIGNISALNRTFDGLIDEPRVSNTIRTADWIKTEYLNQSNPGKFYAISPSNQAQSRPASTPLLKNRGGLIFH